MYGNTRHDTTGHDKTAQCNIRQHKTIHDKTSQDKTKHDTPRQGNIRQYEGIYNKAKQYETGHETTIQYTIIHNITRLPRQDKTRYDNTR